eukprot:g1536.t1
MADESKGALGGNKTSILHVQARQIFDSRGMPTVEVDLQTELGIFRASVPSGSSTGQFEAVELRDGDAEKYNGRGVDKAILAVNTAINDGIKGLDPVNQGEIDDMMVQRLDGTQTEWGWSKGKLGANAILAVSLAVCKAAAAAENLPLWQYVADLAENADVQLPVPAFNVINGGLHAGNKLAIQEVMVLPTGAKTFGEAMRMGAEVYHHLKELLKAKYGPDAVSVGDEGGFVPPVADLRDCLSLCVEAIDGAGYTGKVDLAIDAAASTFHDREGAGVYNLDFKVPKGDRDAARALDRPGLQALYAKLADEFPLVSIEDPFDEEDWEGFSAMTAAVGDGVQVVGDDLLVTNPKRIQKAVAEKACNALLVKPNQIGTVTETIEAVKLAKQAGWGVMVSHRSGETEDSFIADFAVGLCSGQ